MTGRIYSFYSASILFAIISLILPELEACSIWQSTKPPIPETANPGSRVVTFDAYDVLGVVLGDTPENAKFLRYFTHHLSISSFFFWIEPTTELISYFDNENDPTVVLNEITVRCGNGQTFTEQDIQFTIGDTNNHPPVFEPVSAAYEFELPYSAAPINWQQFIKITDTDFEEIMTRPTLSTDRDDLIDLTRYALERVPKDVDQRVEYYMLYFGLNQEWNEEGVEVAKIVAKSGSHVATFETTLTIQKKCHLHTDISQPFNVSENSPAGVPVIVLDVEYVKSINTSVDPINEKYFSFSLDEDAQKVFVTPKTTLATYFDQEDSEILTILGLDLVCSGTHHTAQKIMIHITDSNNRPPTFEPKGATYRIELSTFDHTQPINDGPNLVVKVMDRDFMDVNTALTFTTNRPDIIELTPNPPERVPLDPAQRLEYYKIYFSLQQAWTTVGVEDVVITAVDGAGHEEKFTLRLDINKCMIVSDLSRTFVVSEDDSVGEIVISLNVEGLTGELSSSPPSMIPTLSDDDKYFSHDLDIPNRKINLRPKSSLLANYFNTESSPLWSIPAINLNCSTVSQDVDLSWVNLTIQDVNNRSPYFEPSAVTYDVELPALGAPINWREFIKVGDPDFLEENTAITFSLDRNDLIVLMPEIPERVPADVSSRLLYYKLYIGMNETWTGLGTHAVIITATDGAGNFNKLVVGLYISQQTLSL